MDSILMITANTPHSKRGGIRWQGDLTARKVESLILENNVIVEYEVAIDILLGDYSRTGKNLYQNIVLCVDFLSGKSLEILMNKLEKLLPQNGTIIYPDEVETLLEGLNTTKLAERNISDSYIERLNESMHEEKFPERIRMLCDMLCFRGDFTAFVKGDMIFKKTGTVLVNTISMAIYPGITQGTKAMTQRLGLNEEDNDWMALISFVLQMCPFLQDEPSNPTNQFDNYAAQAIMKIEYQAPIIVLLHSVTGRPFRSVSDDWVIKNFFAGNMPLLEHICSITPKLTAAWSVRCNHFWNYDKKEDAVKLAESGLRENPKSPELRRFLAHGMRMRKEHHDALEIESKLYYENPEEINRNDTFAYIVRSIEEIGDESLMQEWQNKARRDGIVTALG